jgi:hypothetical protein
VTTRPIVDSSSRGRVYAGKRMRSYPHARDTTDGASTDLPAVGRAADLTRLFIAKLLIESAITVALAKR